MTDEEFAKIIKNSNSFREIFLKLGYKSVSGNLLKVLKDKIERLNLSTDHFTHAKSIKRCAENIFIENSTADQSTLRKYYKRGNYSEYICSICEMKPIWNNKDLTLILDHINGINNDDRIENLRWVCPNCNQQLDTTNNRYIGYKTHTIKNLCIDCGKELKGKKSVRCLECERIHKTVKWEDMPIKRDELKQLIRTQPFQQIGRQYNVSGNAVKKWCDKFNLPRKKKDIKNISDDKWTYI